MYKKILLSLDIYDPPTWRKALPAATEYCQALGGELHLIYIVPRLHTSVVSLYLPGISEEKVVADAKKHLADFVADNIPQELDVQARVGYGGIYRGILDRAKEINADLIVMASHHPEMADYLLGPNAARVVRHSDCSVLVVRD